MQQTKQNTMNTCVFACFFDITGLRLAFLLLAAGRWLATGWLAAAWLAAGRLSWLAGRWPGERRRSSGWNKYKFKENTQVSAILE